MVRVKLDEYEDCPFCRKERERRQNGPILGRWTDYWCNRCQGTGWNLVPWEKLGKKDEVK